MVGLLVACPLSTPFPLVAPEAAVLDPALVGTWRAEEPTDDSQARLTWRVFNETELVGVVHDPAAGGGELPGKVDLLRGLVCVIGGENFLSLRELTINGEPGWTYLRYRREGERLLLWVVDDALLGQAKLASTAALRDFVQRNQPDPQLYGQGADGSPDMVLVWVPEAAPSPSD